MYSARLKTTNAYVSDGIADAAQYEALQDVSHIQNSRW